MKVYICIFLLLITFFIYVFTAEPAIPPLDGSEFITVSYIMGIAHPPGYPLFTVLGKYFSFLPLANIAFRINIMSVFFASLTVLFLFFLIYEFCNNLFVSFISSLLFAFSPIFWRQANAAEVFALHSFLVVLMLYLLLSKKNFLYLFSFIFGLSLIHHQTVVLCVPAFLLLLWRKYQNKLFQHFNIIIAFCLLGFCFYCYLPIRSFANPSVDWGNAETFSNFMRVLTRADYGTLSLGLKDNPDRSLFLMFQQLIVFFNLIVRQFLVIGVPIGLFGLWKMYKEHRRISLALLLLFITAGPFFYVFANIPVESTSVLVAERLLIPSVLVFAVWVSYGLKSIIGNIKGVYRYFTGVLCCFAVIVQLKYNYFPMDKSKHYFCYDLGYNTLEFLPEDSVLVVKGDSAVFSVWFHQFVENRRKDISIIALPLYNWSIKQIQNKYENIVFRNNNLSQDDLLKELINRNYSVYLKGFTDIDEKFFLGFSIMPQGLVCKIVNDNNDFSNINWKYYSSRSAYSPEAFKDLFVKDIISQYVYAHEYNASFYEDKKQFKEAESELKNALNVDFNNQFIHSKLGSFYSNIKDTNKAIAEYEQAIKIDPKYTNAYNNLGVLYLSGNELDKALNVFKDAIKINPGFSLAYNNIGVIYIQKNQKNEALLWFKKALEYNPGSEDAKRNYYQLLNELNKK